MTLTFEDPVSRDRRGINRAVCSPGYAVLQFTMSDFLKAWHIELTFAEFTEGGQAGSTARSMQVDHDPSSRREDTQYTDNGDNCYIYSDENDDDGVLGGSQRGKHCVLKKKPRVPLP